LSNPTLAALLLPYLCGVLGLVLFSWWVFRFSRSWIWFTMAFLLLSSNHHLVSFFARGKHYGFDLLASVVIIGLAIRAFKAPSPTTRMAVYGAALVGLFFSSASVFVSVPAIAVLLTGSLTGTGRRELATLALCAMTALFYYAGYLSFQARAGMTTYWAAYMHPTAYLSPFFFKALPPYLRDLIFLIPVGLVWALRDRTWRSAAIAYIGSILLILAFATLGKYPLGGGRMDIWSYPLHCLMFCVGLWRVARWHRLLHWFPHLIAVLCLGQALWLAFADPVFYVDDPNAVRGKMMALARERPLPGDTQQSLWAWCYYNDFDQEPCQIVAEPEGVNGFRIDMAGAEK